MADQPRRPSSQRNTERTTNRTRGQESSKPTKKARKKGRGRRWFYILFFTAALAVVCGIIGYLLIILNGERILTDNQNKLQLNETSIVYDSSNNQVARLANEGYENADFSELPDMLREAVIATEDKRFESHSGIDLYGIGRAVVKDVVARSAVEGASTITQQLAKNLFLSRDKTFFRKATEASIAVALENKLTKDEILTMYLNRIYYGNRIYGVKLAAKYYFNSSLKDLKLWQIATLAGIPKSPNNYNPEDDPERSQERRAVVLQLMYDQGLITQEEMDEAKAVVYKPIDHSNTTLKNKFPSYVDFTVKEALKLMPNLTEDELSLGGYKIYTSLNATAQRTVEEQFADDDNFEQSVDDQLEQGAMIIMDHSSGGIKAMLGGRGYVKKGLNRVVVPRQPGSSFKPISVYGPALETGNYTPVSILRDDKVCYGSYCPSDSNGNKFIGPISMSQSIKESRNASAVWLLNEIGVKTGAEFASRLGIELKPEDKNLAMALGGLTEGVTPLQMAAAYSAFANDGVSVKAHAITKIVDRHGEAVYTFKDNDAQQVMKESTARNMTELLQGVVSPGGTGAGAAIDRPVAGKTGTTQSGISSAKSANRDAWFVGYTPEWTAAIWMGYDKTDKDHVLKKSSKQAAAMFKKVMSEAMVDVPKSSFRPLEDEQSIPDSSNTPPVLVDQLRATYNELEVKVDLSWIAATTGDNITYRIYRKATGESDFSFIADSPITTAEDRNVAPGMTYEYYVTMYNAETKEESEKSVAVRIEVPAETVDSNTELDENVPEQPDNTNQSGSGTGGNNAGNQSGGSQGGKGNGGKNPDTDTNEGINPGGDDKGNIDNGGIGGNGNGNQNPDTGNGTGPGTNPGSGAGNGANNGNGNGNNGTNNGNGGNSGDGTTGVVIPSPDTGTGSSPVEGSNGNSGTGTGEGQTGNEQNDGANNSAGDGANSGGGATNTEGTTTTNPPDNTEGSR